MDMILFEVFLKSIDLIPQQQIYYNGTIHIIHNVIVLSDLVESSGYSSKTLQKGSCPYMRLGRGFTVWPIALEKALYFEIYIYIRVYFTIRVYCKYTYKALHM